MECCDLSSSEILHDFAPRIRVYKDGRVERLLKDDTLSPSFDPDTRVRSKDVAVTSAVSARIYLPTASTSPESGEKLPLVIYFHGGAFCLYSASSSIYHNYLNSLSAAANAVVVSVDYRIAPETPMPACYDDSWAVAQWAAAGSDPWISRWADLRRGVYLAGDSAGANIAHDVLSRGGLRVAGLAAVHPFFGDEEVNELWNYLYPGTSGVYDPRLNPAADPTRMRRGYVGCRRVLVCLGGKDFLKERGVKYYEVLKEGEIKGSWDGQVEYYESIGRGHVFHLYKPNCDEAVELLKRVASFINKKNQVD